MKILITGGSGLFALNSAIELRNKHAVILGLHEKKIALKGVSVDFINYSTVRSIKDSFDKIKPDLVIHAAGITNIEYCETNPESAYKVNVLLTEKIATVCKALDIKMVFISTDHLFSGESSLYYESQEHNPLNVYAKTKSEAEAKVCNINAGAIIVRTNFYGWGTSYRRSFSDYIINEIVNKNFVFLFKDVFYTPILISTLINTMLHLVDKNVDGVFNIVSNESISKYEFGIKLANKFNLDTSLIQEDYLKDRDNLVKRPLDMSLSNKKITQIINRKNFNIEDDLNILLEQKSQQSFKEIINL